MSRITWVVGVIPLLWTKTFNKISQSLIKIFYPAYAPRAKAIIMLSLNYKKYYKYQKKKITEIS